MQDASREQQFFEAARSRGLRPVGRNHAHTTLRRLAAFFASALSREETARRPAPLQRVDPRARLLATLGYLVSLSLARSLPALLAHAVLPPAALALSRIRPREFFGAGFLVAGLFSLLIAGPATLNVVSGGPVLLPLVAWGQEWRVGPYVLPPVIGVSTTGLLTAATLLLRVLASVAAVLWLTLSTRWVDLLRALRCLRLPPLVIQVAGMTVRYLHALLRQAEEVHQGKQSRWVCRAPLGADQAWVGSRIAHAWEKSLHLMDEVHAAMLARGFTGEARLPGDAGFGKREWTLLVAVGVLCATAHWA